MSFRAPAREKWRSTIDLARQTPREAAALRERKILQSRVLQSIAAGPVHEEMALLAFEKAPFCATFCPFFVDFPRVFLPSLARMALWAQIRPRKALLLNDSRTPAAPSENGIHSVLEKRFS
jgi:hypothetical protein